MYSSERFVEYKKGVLIMGKPITEKELEKYDYFREEYFKKNRSWPYTPRPLTDYEKRVMYAYELLPDAEYSYLKRKTTYADFYLSDLYKLVKPDETKPLKSLLFIRDKLKSKGKNFSKAEVEAILSSIYTVYESAMGEEYTKNGVIRLLKDENDSILGYLGNSEYYNKNKSDLAEKILKCKYDELTNKDGLKDFYFDPGDLMLLCSTVFKSIPQNAKNEIENRETYLSDKKSRDYSDFMDMQKEMIDLYKSGKFSKGDSLLRDYTGKKYRLFNGVARHSFDVENLSDLGNKEVVAGLWDMVENTRIISKDLFIKTIIELGKLREKLKNSTGDIKTLWGVRRSEKLYRGLPLYKLLQRIQGGGLQAEWRGKKDFDEGLCDGVARYLVGKTAVDPAPSSASEDIAVAKRFFDMDVADRGATGALLVIDVSNYGKGQDMVPYSNHRNEKEVLLPMGVKLKIKSVVFKKKDGYEYFEVNCVPV